MSRNKLVLVLTAIETLVIGGLLPPRKEAKEHIAEVLEFFPLLKERLKEDASRLSGGEQQMLSLARALVPKPKLLMLYKPSIGLASNLVKSVFEIIVEIKEEAGVSILFVEQKVLEMLEISD